MSCSAHTYELLVKWPTAAPRLVTQSVCWRRSQPRVCHCFFCRVWMTFLFFLSSDTTPASMWLHWEIDETEKKGKKKPQHTPEFVPAHLFFPISLFFQLLRKTKTKAHHRWPTVVNPKSSSARRLGRSFCQDSRENPNEGASHSVVEWVTWPERRGLRAQGVGGGGRGCHRWWGQSPPAPICWEREPLFA